MENWKKQKYCLNCETLLQGAHCHVCGERVLEKKDKQLTTFFGELFHGLFQFENKFLKSLKVLVLSPGKLEQAHIQGIRKRYFSPLQFFLIANIFYFFLPFSDTFNTSLNTQINHLPYSKFAETQVMNHVDQKGDTFEIFEEHYNQQSKEVAKLIVIIFAPLLGMIFKILHFNQKKFYLIDHFNLALGFMTFIIITNLILLPLLLLLISTIYPPFEYYLNDQNLTITVLICILIYLFLALRYLFNEKVMLIIPKSIIITVLFIPCLQIYRYILFQITMFLL